MTPFTAYSFNLGADLNLETDPAGMDRVDIHIIEGIRLIFADYFIKIYIIMMHTTAFKYYLSGYR
jgi:hypothetical protein